MHVLSFLTAGLRRSLLLGSWDTPFWEVATPPVCSQQVSGSCRCALIGVPCRLRMLSILSTFDSMLKLTISSQAKRAETDPRQGTPTRAHNRLKVHAPLRGMVKNPLSNWDSKETLCERSSEQSFVGLGSKEIL